MTLSPSKLSQKKKENEAVSFCTAAQALSKEGSEISCQVQLHVENKALPGSMSCLLQYCGCYLVVKSGKVKPEMQSVRSPSPLVEFAGRPKNGKPSNNLQMDLSTDIKSIGYIWMQLGWLERHCRWPVLQEEQWIKEETWILKTKVIRQVGYFGLKFRCLTGPT